jgi:hypothetical protein
MIFSLVLGFEGKKIKKDYLQKQGKVLCCTGMQQFIAVLILGFSYCSISRQV